MKNRKLLVRLLQENLRKHAGWYATAVLAMMTVAAMTSLSAWAMRDVVNEMVVSRDIERVFAVAAAVAAIFIVKGLAAYAQSVFLSAAGNRIVAEQQQRIYAHLLRQGISFYHHMSSSDLLVRVTHNAQAARGVIDTIVTSLVRDLLSLLGLFAVMFIQQPVLSLVSLIVGPLALIGLRLLLRRVRAIMALELASLATIVQIVQETTIGIHVIKAFGLEGLMQARMQAAVGDVEQRANSIARLEAATSPIMETLSGLAIAGVIALSGVMVLNNGNTPGELMSFITALLLAYDPAKRVARMRVNIESGMVGVAMMFELLDRAATLQEREDAAELRVGPGEIAFKNVHFSYGEGHPTLHDINVIFPAGKMTALVGPSGSGKSTIAYLVMRLYDPTAGMVQIDGVDISAVTLSSLRNRMSYVGQDTFLFAGSVMHNIGLGREGASEAEIIAAAKAANAHDFIISLPHGYHTDVGENGTNLSGGQKQRIAIARAFLCQGDILILDEATSALDSESEALVRDALEHLTRDRTTIVIAHRLSTIAAADQIIVMDAGRIAEQGSQTDLLANAGLYRRLFELQCLPDQTSQRTARAQHAGRIVAP